MPELPETETIARDLNDAVRGAIVSSVDVIKSDVLRECTPKTLDASLRAHSIERVWRRAKLIVFDFVAERKPERFRKTARVARSTAEERNFWHLVIQPRFTGGVLIDAGSTPPSELTHVTVTLHLSDERRLHYRDVRRLGTVALMSSVRFAEYSGALGAEPLDPQLGISEFSALLRGTHRPVKVALMDQKRLAGVGNIYANEALWHAGIDPSRESAALDDDAIERLFAELRRILEASIKARGTSFRDYRDARGERGSFVEQLAAYGRAGEKCLRCGSRLVGTHAIDGRSTVFCAYCQR